MFPRRTLQASLALLAFSILASHASVAEAQGVRKIAQAGQKPAGGVSADSAPKASDDKLDVSDLERKYWAAKDTDFSVVQNRLFNKAGRFSLSLEYGQLLNESWIEGPTYGGSLSYYFTERYGLELSYFRTDSKSNQATDRLNQQGGMPNHNELKGFYGASFNWVPFYAKMSVLNSSIIYFDMAISPGVGVSQYTQLMDDGNAEQTAPTLTLDVTQQFFLNKWLALRFDLKNRWYNEDVMIFKKSSVPAGGDRKASTDLNHTSILMFGLTLYY